MTEESPVVHETASAIVKRVAKKTSVLTLLAAALVLALNGIAALDPRWWFPSVGVLFGGMLGLLNFRWLSISVERVYLRRGTGPASAKIAAMVIHFLKLSAIFVVLFLAIKWDLVHIFGLVTGLSLCFLAILWEGFAIMKRGRILQ